MPPTPTARPRDHAGSAPRLAWPLVHAIPRLDGPDSSIADVCRALGSLANELGLPRPSYEQVRILVHRERRIRALPRASDAALDFVFRSKSPEAAADAAREAIVQRRAARARIDLERSWRPEG